MKVWLSLERAWIAFSLESELEHERNLSRLLSVFNDKERLSSRTFWSQYGQNKLPKRWLCTTARLLRLHILCSALGLNGDKIALSPFIKDLL